jgi:anti-sigma B factor antagonist
MADLEFEITVRESDSEITVIDINGFLDSQTFEEMENQFEELIQKRKIKLIINLSDVEYISSAGAGVFITARTHMEELGGTILLMKPNEAVREVFDILGLSSIFKIVNSIKEGEDYFAQNPN